ncbi:ChbG/HpnK family deacetylase [Paenibacillus arenilitoris]|uniref:ChbG/HpnK family deacetylase n=1 Tax=Paenibacillus arenilitoris TaxID=2772299 RepID=A0A927CK73_9BACL|nr:ChbG/HpnK family deacetylase [Paenibacillus arenilitoris]MBD2867190.1 ChbG/HpnK family deacetylase [Paenibacillus arenilitoris]
MASTIYLVTRGDDLGSSRSANAGILEACRSGLLKNVSVMACAPYAEEAAELLRDAPGVCFGIHATFNAEWDFVRWGPVLPRELFITGITLGSVKE